MEIFLPVIDDTQNVEGECQNRYGNFSHSILLRAVRERSNKPEAGNGNMLNFVNALDEACLSFRVSLLSITNYLTCIWFFFFLD